MAKNTLADLDPISANNTDVLGQSTTGSANANTIDTVFQNMLGLLARFYADLGGAVTVGGSANAITITSASTYQALETGIIISFKASAANTGATTLNLDGLGAKAVRRPGDVALSEGDIVANGRYLAVYDAAYNAAAGAWVLLNPSFSVSSLTQPTLILKQGAAPAPTAEGDIQWDTDDNVLVIGDGAAAQVFVPVPASTAAGDIEYFSGAKAKARLAKGTAAQVLRMNAGATAPEWADLDAGGMTLLGTLTTTSGASQSLTDIPAGYRKLYCEVEGVSPAAASGKLSVALSSTNGAAYGASADVSVGSADGTTAYNGWIEIGGISSAVAAAKTVSPCIQASNGALYSTGGACPTNTAAVVNAIRFSMAQSFDAGTIRIYGVK